MYQTECAHCTGVDRFFSQKVATRQWRRYLKKGPTGTSAIIIKKLLPFNVNGKSLLDIGGGINMIGIELIKEGLWHVVSVDASTGYQNHTKEKTGEMGIRKQFQFYQGNFLDVTSDLNKYHFVTLDRVVCCYPDSDQLLNAACHHSEKYLALSYPTGIWVRGIFAPLINLFMKLQGNPFRFYPHHPSKISQTLRDAGFRCATRENSWSWEVSVWKRT